MELEEKKIGPHDLELTVDLMCSNDYRDRFKAEYRQLEIRIEKLKAFVFKIRTCTDVNHDCSVELLELQLNYMQSYFNILKDRANIELIQL